MLSQTPRPLLSVEGGGGGEEERKSLIQKIKEPVQAIIHIIADIPSRRMGRTPVYFAVPVLLATFFGTQAIGSLLKWLFPNADGIITIVNAVLAGVFWIIVMVLMTTKRVHSALFGASKCKQKQQQPSFTFETSIPLASGSSSLPPALTKQPTTTTTMPLSSRNNEEEDDDDDDDDDSGNKEDDASSRMKTTTTTVIDCENPLPLPPPSRKQSYKPLHSAISSSSSKTTTKTNPSSSSSFFSSFFRSKATHS